jgi:hypothetical protein
LRHAIGVGIPKPGETVRIKLNVRAVFILDWVGTRADIGNVREAVGTHSNPLVVYCFRHTNSTLIIIGRVARRAVLIRAEYVPQSNLYMLQHKQQQK